MNASLWSRRKTLAMLGVAAPFISRALAQSGPLSDKLIEAAKAEGSATFYCSVDVLVAEKLGEAFQKKYPGIKVQIERSGAERVLQRVVQEYDSGIRKIDVIDTSDEIHFNLFKRRGWLTPALSEDVGKFWPAAHRDKDDMFACWRATLVIPGYNSTLIKPDEAPKSWADLLDAKWRGKMVKSHPSYSGGSLIATYALIRAFGWDYLAKLGQQRVLQVQSSTEPPKKLSLGERPLMIDGNEYNAFLLKEKGSPIELIYPAEGSPFVAGQLGVMKDAPHPNAARLLHAFLFTAEAQQLACDFGGTRSLHPAVQERTGRRPLADIKLMEADPINLEKEIETIRVKYASYFGT